MGIASSRGCFPAAMPMSAAAIRFPAGLALRRAVLNRMNAGRVVPDPGALATPYCPSNLAGYVVNDAGPNDPPRYIDAPGVRVI